MVGIPNYIEALLLDRNRSITSENGQIIIPNVAISEMHADSVTVTRHPVDVGANITDHAFVNPSQLMVEFGWSDSSALLNSAISSVLSGFSKGLQTTKEIYKNLLEIMENRELLSVSTGKRSYSNMLITDLKTTTTVDTETSLIVEMTLEQIILTAPQTIQLSEALQKNPAQTAGATNYGGKTMNVWGNYKGPR